MSIIFIVTTNLQDTAWKSLTLTIKKNFNLKLSAQLSIIRLESKQQPR